MSLFTKEQLLKITNNFYTRVETLGKPENTSLLLTYKIQDGDAINSIKFTYDGCDHVLNLFENHDLDGIERYDIHAIASIDGEVIFNSFIDFTHDITMDDLMLLFTSSCPLGVLQMKELA